MSAGSFLVQAFIEAHTKYSELHKTWVDISHRFANIPLLGIGFQREADLDLLLRAIEDEKQPSDSNAQLLLPHHLHSLSHYWIGGMYEIFRLLKQRKLLDNSDLAATIFRDLTLIRMPLEKLEIAEDWKIEAPLELFRSPPNNNDTDEVKYNPKDPLRSFLMPTSRSDQTGSLMWRVIDIENQHSYWVERRWVSDRIIDLWKLPASTLQR